MCFEYKCIVIFNILINNIHFILFLLNTHPILAGFSYFFLKTIISIEQLKTVFSIPFNFQLDI